MKLEEFGKLIADALEVSAQAHPVRVEYDHLMRRSVVNDQLDKDEVLWRVEIQAPR